MNESGLHEILVEKFPSSDPCSCNVCVGYCKRPGWWTVHQAARAIEAGYSYRMMLELSPDRSFAVLSPSFRGNEVNYALDLFSGSGCTFLRDNLCELYGSGLQPLECRFCHHSRKGEGKKCHHEIEKDWNSEYAKRLIVKWGNLTGFWQRQGMMLKEK